MHPTKTTYPVKSGVEGKVTLVELTYVTLLALGVLGGWLFGKIHFGFWGACLCSVLGLGIGIGACFAFAFFLNAIFPPPTKPGKP
jgi:hypothetical protein